MKRSIALIIILLLALMTISCQKTEENNQDPLKDSWEEIIENSKGSTVNLY
jgi:hypothetical protein